MLQRREARDAVLVLYGEVGEKAALSIRGAVDTRHHREIPLGQAGRCFRGHVLIGVDHHQLVELRVLLADVQELLAHRRAREFYEATELVFGLLDRKPSATPEGDLVLQVGVDILATSIRDHDENRVQELANLVAREAGYWIGCDLRRS